MTEVQKKFKSDAQAEFEDWVLGSEAAFTVCARMYLDRAALMEPFLQWCWEMKQEDKNVPRNFE